MPNLRVAYQGIIGSFSSMAAENMFGPLITPLHTQHFREIFNHITANRADVGVVPLENALAGTVQENYDLLNEFNCSIVGEFYLPVALHLLALPMAASTEPRTVATIRSVVSHPKALEQCSFFFENNPHLTQVIFSDTAGAAEFIKEKGDPNTAAIASAKAAELLNLEVLASNIQNHTSNMTRFVAVARSDSNEVKQIGVRDSLHAKCAVIVRLLHTPGTLCSALSALGSKGYNLTKIESRPISGQPFEYRFYIDVTAQEDATVLGQSVTELLLPHTTECRILGAFLCAPESA